jgi:hypothetical protein
MVTTEKATKEGEKDSTVIRELKGEEMHCVSFCELNIFIFKKCHRKLHKIFLSVLRMRWRQM